jgi:hypothetical protein
MKRHCIPQLPRVLNHAKSVARLGDVFIVRAANPVLEGGVADRLTRIDVVLPVFGP